MLRITQSKSADQAKSYYTDGLNRDDYYTEGQEIGGNWGGRGAKHLGLEGEVSPEAFYALCDNRAPATGAQLTPRTVEDRTVGYDFNFHCPKSVSAMYAHTKDERIVSALREAVGDTMREIEAEMQTRVRLGGVQEERTTGNMIWAEFIHKTARPVDGKPDPHLHAHCFVPNATYDEVEQRWKAGYFGDLKRDAPYFEAAFHARLANNIKELDYGIQAKGKFWEIEGVPQSVIDKYSQRRDQIEALAEQLGVTDAAEKDKLGATSREKKVKLSMEQLSAEWASRLTAEEKAALDTAREGKARKQTGTGSLTPQQALDHAIQHVFERESVCSAKDVLEESLRHGVGNVSVEQMKAAFEADPRLIHRVVNGEQRCTTWDVRDQEKKIVASAKETRGILDPIKLEPHQFSDARLNEQQRAAVTHVLSSRDQITLVRGGAGVGKTTLMREAVAGMNQAGYAVLPLAPSADASRGVLREDAGFRNADTVESFLANPALQKKMAGQVIWVDEAGLMSARTTERLLNVAKTQSCRVVLAGDTAQHHAVERGDMMRILEKHAGLQPAEVQTIIRQKGDYRKTIEAIREGRLDRAFATLEKMGAIRENEDIGALHKQLADDYVSLLKSKKKALIVSPQHQEIAAVTKAVRESLRGDGKLTGDDYIFTRLTNLQLTEAQRADPKNYEQGQFVQFTQNAPNIRRGERFAVVERMGDKVMVRDDSGGMRSLPLEASKHFQLYRAEQIPLAAGDKVRITHNSFAKTGQRLNNGSLHDVARITPNGEIEFKNGAVLPKNFGHLTHGYCVTSYASQSKTVNVPLIAQSSLSFNASSLEQVYVSLSRGDENLRIYTDDLKELRERAAKSTARGSAIDFSEKNSEAGKQRNNLDRATEMNRWRASWRKNRDRSKIKYWEWEKDRQRETAGKASREKKGRSSHGRGLQLTIGL